MPTIDLTTPPPAPEGTLQALPRRIALTLPELRLLASRSGGAPLPFDVTEPETDSTLENRLGQSRLAADDAAYVAALGKLHDPADSLARRGLLVDDEPDAGVAGALGLLATPSLAVDLDVVVERIHGRAWHRQRGDAVATLATTDGIVFELAWFATGQWAGELARVAVLPEDLELDTSALPDLIDLPYELLDAGAEAVRTGRTDLLGTIVAHHSGTILDGAGAPVGDAVAAGAVGALVAETQGRLRALAADVDAGGNTVGVVSWVLLADGWRQLRAYQSGASHRVEVRRVHAADLAGSLGPVLAEVTA